MECSRHLRSVVSRRSFYRGDTQVCDFVSFLDRKLVWMESVEAEKPMFNI